MWGTRWFPDSPDEADRPGIFALLFWSCLVVSYAAHAFGLFDERRFGVVLVTPAVVTLTFAWIVLPWSPGAGWHRKLVAPIFLLATFAVCYLTNLNLSIVFYAIVVANGVFLFGFRRGIAYAGAALVVFFFNLVLVEGNLWVSVVVTAVAVPFAVFVVGVCAAVVEARQRREQAQNLLRELESANAELEDYAARVGELSVSEERARMAREIHDSVGHHLTVINLQLQNARRFKEREPDRAWDEVEAARGMALEALSEVRRSVRALKPLAVEGGGGAGALSALARNFGGTGIEVAFEVEGEERGLAGETGLVLYRAMQEGLTNAAKHSGARRVRATLSFGPETARLVVADDGAGAGEETSGRGFGLSSLKERVEALDGTLSWGDRPEGGFVLEVGLPVGG